jgi:hypothetical protein
MTDKEKALLKRRIEFKKMVGEMLKDTNLSYPDIGRAIGRTKQRVYQLRKELGFPRRIGKSHRTYPYTSGE